MTVLSCALALLSGAVGAGFASGREIVRFFAAHGPMAAAAILGAVAVMGALFVHLPAQMERAGVSSLPALCRSRFGPRLGTLCAALFALLCAVTGGAMLAACAELAALTLPLPHSYGLGLCVSLLLGAVLAHAGLYGLALPGAALAVLLPVLLLRLLAVPVGEACFSPAMAPDLPVRALTDGVLYGALNAALLAGALPLLLPLSRRDRRRTAALFCAGFSLLLALGTAVCRRHLSAVMNQPMPFVVLSRALGPGGYALVAACLYAAALSTLCALLAALVRLLPLSPLPGALAAAALCLFFAYLGFDALVAQAYPVLGAVCTGLLTLLCVPLFPSARQYASSSSR